MTSRRYVLAALVVLAATIGIAAALHLHRTEHAQAPPESAEASAPERPAQLGGRILDPNGEAVVGAHVRVVAEGHVLAMASTNRAGHFAFDGLPLGPARVAADHDPEGAVRSAPIDVSSLPTELTLVLAPASVLGIVVDADDAHPIAGATLSVEGGVAGASTATVSDGTFRFAVVPFEISTLVASAPGYVPSRVTMAPREDKPEPDLRVVLRVGQPVLGDVLDDSGRGVRARVIACEGQPTEVSVDTADDGSFSLPPQTIGCDAVATHDAMGPSDPVRIDAGRRTTLRLQAGGGIAGNVVDERASPVDAFSVGVESFVASRGSSSVPGTTAFSGGTFRFDRLSPGTYVLTAFTKGRPPARSTPIAVRSGAVTSGVRIVLTQGGTVVGRVIDDSRSPLAGVELRFDLVSAITGSDAVATTDASGRYRLDGAPAGPLTLLAKKEGYRTKLVSGVVVDAGRTVTRDITLAAVDGGPGLELAGIGANIQSRDGHIVLANLFQGDPAERSGLHVGDRIVRIDGESTAGMSVNDAIQRIRGEPGTAVGLSIERDGVPQELVVTRATVVH